jgi:hypothetical protein
MFVQPEDLQRLAGLGGRPFEELLYDLVVVEASRHGIPLSAVHWDHRTNIGDGGRDIVVDAQHVDANPRFIPQRRSFWSVKSGRDGIQPRTLRQELIDSRHPAVRQHLEGGNPYIWCTLHPMSEDQRSALQAEVREVAVEPSAYIFNPELVEYRGLTTLCTLLNDHPGLVAKHLPDIARAFEGALNLEEWEAQDRAGFATAFVDFADRSQLVAQVRSHLRARSGPNVLHLAGLSGVGKTRTVLEACRDQRDLSGVLYIPRYPQLRERLLRHLTRNPNLFAFVVIDEVPLEDLRSLTSQVEHLAHRLRLVTIGPARRNERGRPTANILVLPEPDTRQGVLEVVRRAGAGISEPVLESIADFAAHDLRLALMLVEATRQDGNLRDLPIEDGEDVWRRVTGLFGARLGDVAAFQVHYPRLTVAIDIGVQGDLRHELETIANQFGIEVARLDEVIAAAEPCGLGIKTTNFFEPVPRALAGHLFRQRIWGALQPRLAAFLSELPERLRRRFVERCQECTGPEREEMEEALARFFWSALGTPDVTRLIDRGRSRVFKAWAELDPSRGLEWLKQAIERASDEQLAALHGEPDGSGGWQGRRQVVWLCESLASFAEYFLTCEAILFRLAQVETEPSIGNNSTAIWKGMYPPALAFTEVPFPDRANRLLERLAASSEKRLSLVMSAVVETMVMPGGRMVPPAIVGGRVVPEPWRPDTYVDLYRLQRDFGLRALETIGRMPAGILGLARRLVVGQLPTFARLGLVRQLRQLLDGADSEVKQGLRPQLERAIEIRERAQERRPSTDDPVLPELRRWHDDLRPAGLAERVQELTARDYWDVTRGVRSRANPQQPSPYVVLAQDVLGEPELLGQLVDWFDSGKPRSAFAFAVALGGADQHDALTPTIGSWLEAGRCRGMVAGYLQGVGSREGTLPDEWKQGLERAAGHWPEYAGLVTVDADFSRAGFQRIMRLVESGALAPTVLTTFDSPKWEPHVGSPERSQILDLLLGVSDRVRALGAALHLGTSWTRFGKESVPAELAAPVTRLLHDALGVRVDPGDWSPLLESLAATHPQETASLAVEALTSNGPLRVSLQDLVLPTLIDVARRSPAPAMDAIGRQILDPARAPFFCVLIFPGLFEAVGLAEVQRWMREHGAEYVRYIARQLDSPRLENGVPLIPPVTDWVLTEFGENDRVWREFCAGRHAFEVREGHARDHRAELELELEPFRNNPKPWVRRWAEYELRENERDAELDDMLEDRFERL